ncbi:MAG: pantetheine-phosphate adenylyltransferase [Eubacteriales bacterium]
MNKDKNNAERQAILPGSYDPITTGHMDILRRCAKLYDKVYLAVLINSSKKYLFDMETRVRLAKIACRGIENAEVVSSDGLLTDLAEALGCRTIIKGIRGKDDLDYELSMAEYNRAASPETETLLMPCEKRFADISSTRVRNLISEGKWSEAEALLPDGTLDVIRNLLK